MPIDLSKVTWDEPAAANAPSIDAAKVKWDKPAPEPSLARDVGVATRGLTPYATAAATGAVMGSLAGPAAPLAIPLGAGAGLFAMGLTDLGIAGYNKLAEMFGSKTQVPTYTESMQNALVKGGMGVEPVTPSERMISAAATGAGAGLSVPTAARAVLPLLRSPATRELERVVQRPIATGVAETLAQQPVLQTVGGVTGALAPQALTEYTDVRNPIALTAAGLVGGAVPAGAIGLKDLIARGMFAGRNKLAEITDPTSKSLIEAAEGQGPRIVNSLRAATEDVPGSKPTAAQASVDANVPRFTAFAKQAEQVLPAEYYDIALAQRAARPAAIENVTPQPAAPFKTLEEGRAAASGPLYKAAEAQPNVQERGAFAEIMNRPAMRQAINAAETTAAEEGRPFVLGQNKPAEYMAGAEVSPQTFREYPVSSLLDVKVNLDQLIAAAKTGRTEPGDLLAMQNTRRAYVNWLEKNVPDYEAARGTHRLGSVSIDQRNTLNNIKDKLTSALSEEAPQKAAAFAESLRNAPATIKKATGESRYKSLDEYMSPQQVDMLNNIRLDLARDAKVQELVKRGGGVEPGIQQMVSKSDAGVPSVALLNRVYTIIQNVAKRYQGQLDDKMAKELALQFRDPKVAAQRLEEALAWEANLAAKKPPARTPIPSAVVGAPGIVNVFANRENRNAMAR